VNIDRIGGAALYGLLVLLLTQY